METMSLPEVSLESREGLCRVPSQSMERGYLQEPLCLPENTSCWDRK